MAAPSQSSTEQPASPAPIPSFTVSATPAGSSAKHFSKSADTGTSTAATTAAAWLTASSRLTDPSGRPKVAANPPLVVAKASKPTDARILAEPSSHGFGITSGAGPWCKARKRSAFSTWVAMHRNLGRPTQRPCTGVGEATGSQADSFPLLVAAVTHPEVSQHGRG